jgi:hypothetical protein
MRHPDGARGRVQGGGDVCLYAEAQAVLVCVTPGEQPRYGIGRFVASRLPGGYPASEEPGTQAAEMAAGVVHLTGLLATGGDERLVTHHGLRRIARDQQVDALADLRASPAKNSIAAHSAIYLPGARAASMSASIAAMSGAAGYCRDAGFRIRRRVARHGTRSHPRGESRGGHPANRQD